MPRFEKTNWSLQVNASGHIKSWEQVQVAVLMDIRGELQKLNKLLQCPNFAGIPVTLRSIRRAMPRRRRKQS